MNKPTKINSLQLIRKIVTKLKQKEEDKLRHKYQK